MLIMLRDLDFAHVKLNQIRRQLRRFDELRHLQIHIFDRANGTAQARRWRMSEQTE
jgi:hypothetical protein